MHKPAIPSVPKPSETRDRFDQAVKETLEIFGGARANKLAHVPANFTLNDLRSKINQLIALLQDSEVEAVTGAGRIAPAFAAHKNTANQTGIVTATATKVTFSTEDFDTNENFANSTFTPTVQGQYQLNAHVAWIATTDMNSLIIYIYKNGAQFRQHRTAGSGTVTQAIAISCLVEANGTTDYFEVYAYQATGVDQTISGTAARTFFDGCYVGRS